MSTIAKKLVVTLDSGQTVLITPADEYVMGFMLGHGRPNQQRDIISAIKYIRMVHGVGLKEAKDIVELYDTLPQ